MGQRRKGFTENFSSEPNTATPSSFPAPRIPSDLQIELRRSYARKPNQLRIQNISKTGACLENINSFLQANDHISVTLAVHGRIRKIQAHVVWAKDQRAGIKFLPMSYRDIQIVDDLMDNLESFHDDRKDLLDDIFTLISDTSSQSNYKGE